MNIQNIQSKSYRGALLAERHDVASVLFNVVRLAFGDCTSDWDTTLLIGQNLSSEKLVAEYMGDKNIKI